MLDTSRLWREVRVSLIISGWAFGEHGLICFKGDISCTWPMVQYMEVIHGSSRAPQVTRELAPNYPDVKLEFMYVDNAAMKLIQAPSYFDVIATSNMYGEGTHRTRAVTMKEWSVAWIRSWC